MARISVERKLERQPPPLVEQGRPAPVAVSPDSAGHGQGRQDRYMVALVVALSAATRATAVPLVVQLQQHRGQSPGVRPAPADAKARIGSRIDGRPQVAAKIPQLAK